MSPTQTNETSIDREILADMEEVCRQAAAGGVRDPELIRRVTERAEKARKEMLARFGLQDIGVGIIREMRGELPPS